MAMRNRWLAAPYLIWMLLFTIIPLGIVVYFAFTDSITGRFTLENLSRIGNYMPIFLNSAWLALISIYPSTAKGHPITTAR